MLPNSGPGDDVNPNDAAERQPDVVRLAHFANDLVEAPPEATAPACPSVCLDAVGRNSPHRQFAPNHLAADADFFRNVGEGTSLLAHADDCRNFIVEQCHTPCILCCSQLATMFRPTPDRWSRRLSELPTAWRVAPGSSADACGVVSRFGYRPSHWTSRCPECSPTLCRLPHPRVRSPGAGQGGSGEP